MATIIYVICTVTIYVAIIYVAIICVPPAVANVKTEENIDSPLIIALLHFAPVLGNIEANRETITKAMTIAKSHRVEWLLTPELALTGYHFQREIGTAWIKEGPDSAVQLIKTQARIAKIGVLLSHIERPLEQPESIFNTLFVINSLGEVVARHRKINTIPQSEDWASKGVNATLVSLSGYRVGMLICADAWPSQHAAQLKAWGAQLIVSSANWGPGQYGPGDTWEKRSLETAVPWIVNNRTGVDKTLDLRKATSVVSEKGKRIFEHASETNALILLYWRRTQPTPTLVRTQVIGLDDLPQR